MPRYLRIGLKSTAVVLSGLVIGLIWSATTFTLVECANTVIAESLSPDSEWKAVLFERSCGATTGYSTQVSLIRSRSDLENDGALFRFESRYSFPGCMQL